MSGHMGIDLLREWVEHNERHACYYESAEYDGMAECPSYYATLGDFLGAAGFPVENLQGTFFGRVLSEPNFRSRNSGTEKPVSIAERRRAGDLRANKGIHYRQATDEALRERSQRARGEAVENEQAPWEVQAMEYFSGRLDEIHESMVRAFAGVMAQGSRHETLLSDLLTSVNALEEKITERSEVGVAAEPKVVIPLENVPADVAEELQAELTTRVQRLIARRQHMTETERAGRDYA